ENVEDFTGPRERSDLGFIIFDINADILYEASKMLLYVLFTMNTVLSRANSLFAFSLSVMAALTFGCFITTAFKDRVVPVNIHVSRALNQVVLWDKIILRGDNPKLSLKEMKSKYFFFDDGNGL
ncbi:hypothetical protein AB205_0191300, partial [Aquarana catesbeiana]